MTVTVTITVRVTVTVSQGENTVLRWRWKAAAWLLLCLLSVPLYAQDSPAPPRLGITLSSISTGTTQHPFADVFHTAGPWALWQAGDPPVAAGTPALTPEGWVASLEPGQYAEARLFTAEPATARGLDGLYTLVYDGEGRIEFGGSNATLISSEPGTLIVDLRPSQGVVQVQVHATQPANPLRNLRLLLPGAAFIYELQPFNLLFQERIRPFAVLRFTDWMQTDNSSVRVWDDRAQVSDATYTRRGVPLETMIALANVQQAAPWFNMPHLADDDYVRRFATLVRDTLAAELPVYVEYSAEVWDTAYSQATFMQQRGSILNLGAGDAALGGLRYYAQRSREVFAIWEEVFGGPERLVRVVAAAGGDPAMAEAILSWQETAAGVDALAIAPYLSCADPGSPATAEEIAALSVDAWLDRQAANVQPGGCALVMMEQQVALAQQYGVEPITYAGGQRLAVTGDTATAEALRGLFIAANRNPRMGDIYTDYFNAWRAAGGGLMVAGVDIATPAGGGSPGLLEYLTQNVNSAPRYAAALRFVGAPR